MKQANEPIVLSGRIFVDKLLAIELAQWRLPERVRPGDVKLLAIPKGHGYTGFIRAYVLDADNTWRNMALRKEAAVSAIYHGEVERRQKAGDVVKHLRSLAGATATWGDKTYEVRDLPAVPSAQPAARALLPVPQEGPVADCKTQTKPPKPVQLTLPFA
ncbi:MAG TPA: hypothetical protein V6D17_09215 [Candidatus Obscuribacterales bacterium]